LKSCKIILEKRKATIFCAKNEFLRQASYRLVYAATPSGFGLYAGRTLSRCSWNSDWFTNC